VTVALMIPNKGYEQATGSQWRLGNNDYFNDEEDEMDPAYSMHIFSALHAPTTRWRSFEPSCAPVQSQLDHKGVAKSCSVHRTDRQGWERSCHESVSVGSTMSTFTSIGDNDIFDSVPIDQLNEGEYQSWRYGNRFRPPTRADRTGASSSNARGLEASTTEDGGQLLHRGLLPLGRLLRGGVVRSGPCSRRSDARGPLSSAQWKPPSQNLVSALVRVTGLPTNVVFRALVQTAKGQGLPSQSTTKSTLGTSSSSCRPDIPTRGFAVANKVSSGSDPDKSGSSSGQHKAASSGGSCSGHAFHGQSSSYDGDGSEVSSIKDSSESEYVLPDLLRSDVSVSMSMDEDWCFGSGYHAFYPCETCDMPAPSVGSEPQRYLSEGEPEPEEGSLPGVAGVACSVSVTGHSSSTGKKRSVNFSEDSQPPAVHFVDGGEPPPSTIPEVT